jgi:hypothetical protein
MRIIGIEGMTGQELREELIRGGKFVIYEYCISLIVLTVKRPSNIYFIRSGESAVAPGLVFSVLSLFLGWWGFPFGPIFTIWALVTNFAGGRDVTHGVLAQLR